MRPDVLPDGPPAFFERLLGVALRRGVADHTILGDLREEFARRARGDRPAARRWYRRTAVDLVLTRFRDTVRPKGHRGHSQPLSTRSGDFVIQQFWRDARYAIRALRRAPAFTGIAVVTLALGIGANTTIFSVINGVLLRPLPYEDADALVGVFHTAPGLGYPQFGMSPGIYFQYAEHNQVFEETALFSTGPATITGPEGDAQRVAGARVTQSLFATLRVTAAMGRVFTPDEDVPDANRVVVIGHGLWQRRFGGNADVLGRTIRVNGDPHAILGVMPAGFSFPDDDTELWAPMRMDPAVVNAGNFGFDAVARLRSGVTPEYAQQQIAPLLHRVREIYSGQPNLMAFMDAGQMAPLVTSFKEEIVGDLRRPLWILMGTVAFVLLIACVNVANLLLVRTEGRRRELAVRAALGAERATLIRQFLVESIVLAALGGLGAVALAAVGIPILLRAAPQNLPRLGEVGIDAAVVLFTGGVVATAAVVFGLAPAFRYTAPGLMTTLRQGGRGSTAGHRQYVRNLLVGGQAGLALMLLVGSGLMVRSFWRIRSVDAGFNWENVLTFRISLPNADYPTPGSMAAFHSRLLQRLEGLPGVTAVGATEDLPLGGRASGTAHEIEDRPTPAGELPPMLWYTYATPGYFETMQIPIRRGRAFQPSDHEQPSGNLIVSRAMAGRFWPDGDPIGRRIRFPGDSSTWFTIVGVAGDVRDRGLREEPSEIVYYPMVSPAQDSGWSTPNMTYVVRSARPLALASAVRAEIRALDPGLPVAGLQTMADVVGDSVVRLSFTMLALVLAAAMALMLGGIGLYGVLSYLVSQRKQEIGVRIALGAQPGQVRWMVVVQGARIVGIGVVVGIAGAAGLTRLLQGLLYDTAPLDPITFATMSTLLVGVGLLASYLPARRASTVDPVRSLRQEA